MNIPKPTRWKSKKYRDAARNQPCTMALPCCNGNTETTVLAHKNGGGMGTKHSDYNAADMCSDCHDAYDSRWKSRDHVYTHIELEKYFDEARFYTIANRIERGILK